MAKGILIVIKPEDKAYLDSLKGHPRETYGDIVSKLITCWRESQEGISGLEDKPKLSTEAAPDSTTMPTITDGKL